MSYRIRYRRNEKWVSVHPEPKWPEWFDYTDPYNAKWIKSKYPQGLPCNTDYMRKEGKNEDQIAIVERYDKMQINSMENILIRNLITKIPHRYSNIFKFHDWDSAMEYLKTDRK